MACECFLSSCLPLPFALSSLCYAHILWFALVSIICFPPFFLFLWTLVVLHLQNYCPHTVLWFSHVSSIATVSALHLSFFYPCTLIFICNLKEVSNFIDFFVHTLSALLIKEAIFFHHVFWAPLSKTSEGWIWGLVSCILCPTVFAIVSAWC